MKTSTRVCPVCTVVALAACGGASDGNTASTEGASGSASGGTAAEGNPSGGSSSETSATGGENASGGVATAGSASVGGSADAGGSSATGLDVLVLLDTSGSTSCSYAETTDSCASDEPSRLERMVAAVSNFVGAMQGEGMGVGLSLFGHQRIGMTSCDPAEYATPLVEMDFLPGNAQRINDALGTLEPTGETPTGSAIEGACVTAQAWQLEQPERHTVILLVTDGEPGALVSCPDSGCCPTLPDAAIAAELCYSATSIATYVIAAGPNLASLSQLAEASGTSVYLAPELQDLEPSFEQFRTDALAAANE